MSNQTNEQKAQVIFPNVYEELAGEIRHNYVEIAKRIRADIKQAVKTGLLPEGKYSVRKRSNAIDVEIVAIACTIYNPEWFALRNEPYPVQDQVSRWTPEAKEAVAVLKIIHDRYNYDRSDIMTDYFDVNYYGGVSFGDCENDEYKALEAGEEAKASHLPKNAKPVVAAKTAEATVTHNPRKNGIEIRFASDDIDPIDAQWLKQKGYRYSVRQDMFYTRFSPEALAAAREQFSPASTNKALPDSVQVGSGF